MRRFILSLDQGTTGSTAMVVDFSNPQKPFIVASSNCTFPQIYPKPGWVEHEPQAIIDSLESAIRQVFEDPACQSQNIQPSSINAIGITNQRETVVVLNEHGEPVHNAIVWQCKRSEQICQAIKDRGQDKRITELTGLPADPYFSGSKLQWLSSQGGTLATALQNKKSKVATMDTFVLHWLSGGTVHKTEPSNACRTLLFDIDQMQWSSELCDIFEVSLDVLAQVCPTVGAFGTTKGLSCLPDGIPITAMVGDQQAALAGHRCLSKGQSKCTYGTGAFLLCHTGQNRVNSKHGLLTTVAWQVEGETSYALEGSCFVAAAACDFLKDQLGMLDFDVDFPKLGSMYAAPDVVMVPSFSGLGSPYWNPHARAAILGMTRGTTRMDVIRACLEGIAFQVCDVLDAFNSDRGEAIASLAVDGGLTRSERFLQIQSDLAQCAIERPKTHEMTALGAALFAAVGSGAYESLEDLDSVEMPCSTVQSEMKREKLRHSGKSGTWGCRPCKHSLVKLRANA